MQLLNEAIQRFNEVFDRARKAEVNEPSAMTLATASADGRPSARIVLLKGVDASGFVFYTNTLSRKGRQLAENPRAALCFYWQPLWEQVLVEGTVKPVSDAEADAYWRTRPRLSQIGAWASRQSEPLPNRTELEERVNSLELEYEGVDVPRPPHWSGYRLAPDMIEFWCGRSGRLHDRDRYWLENGEWRHSLLNP
ncbi:MAG: pyridoxamine 5'-phosphate oxidase [Ectothiorhodospiraceae bacterium]|jgi:pyridoxamine 5'-phosphate oxidase